MHCIQNPAQNDDAVLAAAHGPLRFFEPLFRSQGVGQQRRGIDEATMPVLAQCNPRAVTEPRSDSLDVGVGHETADKHPHGVLGSIRHKRPQEFRFAEVIKGDDLDG